MQIFKKAFVIAWAISGISAQSDPDFDAGTLEKRLDQTLWRVDNTAISSTISSAPPLSPAAISSSNPILSFSHRLPEHLDIFCENIHGNEDINYRTCQLSNLCFDLKLDNFFWLPIRHSGMMSDIVGLRGGIYGHVFPLNASPSTSQTPAKDELVVTVENPALFFIRFVPNNLYHVIHEDLFPLLLQIAAFKELREAPEGLNRLLIHADAYPPEKYVALYELLGPFVGINPFKQSHAHGPNQKRGDRFGPSRLFDQKDIGQSVSFLANWFRRRVGKRNRESCNLKATYQTYFDGMQSVMGGNVLSPNICIISRRQSRKLVNQDRVVQILQEAFPGFQVTFLEDEDSPKVELLQEAMDCFAIVAAHGASLVAAAFLAQGAMVYEVFPFGLYLTEAVRMYQSLAGLPEMRIHYRSAHSPLLEEGHEKAEQAVRATVPPSYIYGIRMTAQAPNFACCSNVFQIYKLAQNVEIDTVHLITSLKAMMQEELEFSS